MANCPNCGRATARTTDWCCQWCGYPLFSGTFKTINKSYEQLKRERTAPQAEVEDEAVPREPETYQAAEEIEEESIEEPAREEIPRRIVRQEARPPVRRRRIIKRRRPAPPPPEPEVEEYVEYVEEDTEDEYEEYVEEYEDEPEEEEVYEDEYEDEYEEQDEDVVLYEERPPKPVRRPGRMPRPVETRREPPPPVRRRPPVNRRPAPLPGPEVEEYDDYDEGSEEISEEEHDVYPAGIGGQPSDEYEADGEPEEEEPEIEEEPEEPEPPVVLQPQMELAVEELISAYETEGPQADARFAGKILKISGIVSRVEVKEALAVYAIILETPDANPMRQTLRCVFGREYRDELQYLAAGQEISVQGKYDGSIINISMRDCILLD